MNAMENYVKSFLKGGRGTSKRGGPLKKGLISDANVHDFEVESAAAYRNLARSAENLIN